MSSQKKVAVIIPCHNEQSGIRKVLKEIPYKKLQKHGYKLQVIVIDNNSTDKTALVAKAYGAVIIHEEKKGKGNALRTGFRALDADVRYVVMLDGDNTYKPGEMLRMLEPLESGFCDVVVGSRLGGKMKKHSLHSTNRAANWLYTFLVRHMYQANITDVLSGYFAWKKKVVDDLLPHIESRGFSIEVDMITKMKMLGYEMCSVPITYDVRVGETKIQAIEDGLKILGVLFLNMIWKPDIRGSRRTIFLANLKKPFLYVKQVFTPYEESNY
jgi:dolichol-phosphate hexosyltransferase